MCQSPQLIEILGRALRLAAISHSNPDCEDWLAAAQLGSLSRPARSLVQCLACDRLDLAACPDAPLTESERRLASTVSLATVDSELAGSRLAAWLGDETARRAEWCLQAMAMSLREQAPHWLRSQKIHHRQPVRLHNSQARATANRAISAESQTRVNQGNDGGSRWPS